MCKEWDQLTFNCSGELQADFLSELLFAQNALSVTFSEGESAEAIFGGVGTQTLKLWQNTIVTALFEPLTTKLVTHLLATINQQLTVPIEIQRFERLEEKDWSNVWKQYFKPIQISNKLCICPSWLTPPDSTTNNIIIDPGQAFGTGTHSTTKLCLEWLSNQSLTDKIVLDYGTGSGILAIVAKKLGAKTVYATDIDPVSLTVCRTNAAINATELRIQPINHPLPNVNILMANILYKPLCDLSVTFESLLTPGSTLVLSGILENQIIDLKKNYPYVEWSTLKTNEHWSIIAGNIK